MKYKSLIPISIISTITLFLTLFFSTCILALLPQTIDGRRGILYLLFGVPLTGLPFTLNELSHMTEVRHIFIIFEIILILGIVILSILQKTKKSVLTTNNYKLISYIVLSTLFMILVTMVIVDLTTIWIKLHEIIFPNGNFAFAFDSFIKKLYPDSFFLKFVIFLISELFLFSILLLSFSYRDYYQLLFKSKT